MPEIDEAAEQTDDTVAQPESTETVETTTQEPPATEAAAPPAAAAPPVAEAPKTKFLGQFDTPEQAAYFYKGKAEAGPAHQPDTKPTAPQYTQDQLWSLRAQKMQEIASAQIAGDTEKAGTAAAQVNWIDNQMLDMRIGSVRKEMSGQSAYNTLVSETQDLLKPYAADLVPGNPLNEEATRLFGLMKQAYDSGQSIEQILSGAAVLAAAAKTGKNTAGVELNARKEFSNAMQQTLKQAVLTGAGKAAKPAEKAPDFGSMTDEQFRAYERKIGARHD